MCERLHKSFQKIQNKKSSDLPECCFFFSFFSLFFFYVTKEDLNRVESGMLGIIGESKATSTDLFPII